MFAHPVILTNLLFATAAASAGVEVPESIASAVSKFINRAGITDNTPGLAVLVNDTANRRMLLQFSIGQADLRAKTEIGAQTPFRIASVSKTMTATAILQLAERGKLNLKAPVRRFLPTTPWDDITLHHLLSHTAGPPEYTSFQFLKSNATNTDILNYMEGKKLRFTPGTERRYSNTGYAMLASVIESVTGKSFPDYMQREIFEAAGMKTASVPGLNWESVPNRAVGYNRVLRQYLKDDADFLNGVVGDGGVYASAADLDQWLTAFFSNRLVSKKSVKLALSPVPAKRGEQFQYGYGWIIERLNGEKLAWHNGSWVGFDTFVGRLVGKRVNIVILSNAGLDTRNLQVSELGFSIASWLIARRK